MLLHHQSIPHQYFGPIASCHIISQRHIINEHHTWNGRKNDKIEDKTVTSMWDEEYLIDWFKQLGLNQIRGGLLKESHMINAWFRLLNFPNNRFHEIGSLLSHYGRKIYNFPFSPLSYFYFNCLVSILIDVRHLSLLGFWFDLYSFLLDPFLFT